MKNYCCDNFNLRYETNREMGINIRIVKLTEDEIINIKDLEDPFRFFITEGYEIGQSNIKMMLINFCPFCGQKLKQFYSSDEYINENIKNLYNH